MPWSKETTQCILRLRLFVKETLDLQRKQSNKNIEAGLRSAAAVLWKSLSNDARDKLKAGAIPNDEIGWEEAEQCLHKEKNGG